MKQPEALLTVYWAASMMEGELVRGRLEAEGIPALLTYESLAQTLLGGAAQVQVKVPTRFAQRAQTLLRNRDQ